MGKGLFLDRDGVVNRELGRHTMSVEEFDVLPGVCEAIALANTSGWTVVVITNQSGIGLGLYDHEAVDRMHRYLHDMLRTNGTSVAEILYCPHHPSKGRCLCRKPGGLLLERAAARHDIDLPRSVMIGDRERDIRAAQSAGARGILVDSNRPLLDTIRTHDLIG
ncbi:MAG: HAD family hydrolase [Flavobacteriales bacterium]|nr:HAD family hydrolase [Flavobacteriales bacterium]